MNSKFFVLTLVSLFFNLQPSCALEIKGIWHSGDGEATLRLSYCEPNLCAKIVGLKNPLNPETGQPALDVNNPDVRKRSNPIIGLDLFADMKPMAENSSGADNSWKGKIYDPDGGKFYEAHVRFDGAKIVVKGCALGGLLCRDEVWVK